MEKRQLTRLASAGVLAVVFASGTLVGMAVDRALAPDQGIAQVPAAPPEQSDRAQGQNGRGGRGNRPTERRFFFQEVGLSPEKLQAADSIVRVHRVATGELERAFRRDADSILEASGRRQQFRQDLQTAVQGLRNDIRSLMTADQLVVYDSLLTADDQRRRTEEERRRLERGQRSGNRPN
jgi:hypothetical protein